MSLLSLSPSPFSSSPLHGFRLPKSSSGRSGGCGEADWATFFQPMTDDCEEPQQPPSSLPFLSVLDAASPPLASPGKLFSPLDCLQSSPLQSSSLTASLLSSRRQEAPLSARRAEACAASPSACQAAAASTSCPTASFAPLCPSALQPHQRSNRRRRRRRAPSRAQLLRLVGWPTLLSPAPPRCIPLLLLLLLLLQVLQRGRRRRPATPRCPTCPASITWTFEVLSLDSMTGCDAFAPSASAVFDFDSLHAPLHDAANAAEAAASGLSGSGCRLLLPSAALRRGGCRRAAVQQSADHAVDARRLRRRGGAAAARPPVARLRVLLLLQRGAATAGAAFVAEQRPGLLPLPR